MATVAAAVEGENKRKREYPAPGPEQVKKHLERLSNHDLLEIVQQQVAESPQLLTKIVDKLNRDPANKKLFVRGLPFSTTTPQLLELFAKFGEVEEGTVVYDKANPTQSRGFGFVNFSSVSGVFAALEQGDMDIQGRTVRIKLADAPASDTAVKSKEARTICVRGLRPDVTTDRLLRAFAGFGEIELGFVSSFNGKSKGFGFVSFRSPEVASRVLAEPCKQVEGKTVQCTLENPAEAPPAGEVGRLAPMHQEQNQNMRPGAWSNPRGVFPSNGMPPGPRPPPGAPGSAPPGHQYLPPPYVPQQNFYPQR